MSKKKKYVTNINIFNWIVEDVKKRGAWPEPDVIESANAYRQETDIKDYHFVPLFVLDYGNCEGMYLTLSIQGQIDNTDEQHTVKLGSIKCLSSNDETVRIMAALYGECLISFNQVIEEHDDELTRSGYSLFAYVDEDNRGCGYVGIKTLEGAKAKYLELQRYTKNKYHHGVIKDNDTENLTFIDAEGSIITCPICRNSEILGKYCHICGTNILKKKEEAL